MSNELVGGDIYQIEKFVDEIKKEHIDIDENVLKVGMFGYLGDIFSREINIAINMSSEGLNQLFPTRATNEKYILIHAVETNIQDIEAVPSQMRIYLGLSKSDIERNMTDNILILDRFIPLRLNQYELHFDYDIRIQKNVIDKKHVFTARYLMDDYNPVSDLENPYILPPVQFNIDGEVFIFFDIIIRQVFIEEQSTKILSNDSLDNKIHRFSFNNKLAKFHIIIKHPNKTETTLYPVYKGTPLLDNSKTYCYYDYYSEDTVRVYFIDGQYIPSINDEIVTITQTTFGADGNFEYNKDFEILVESQKIQYKDLKFLCKVMEDAMFGKDSKSIDELKSIIPKERLGRDVITTQQDLENFFNALYDEYNVIKFYKKIHNQNEIKYSAYLLMKDIENNIIPTNTLDFEITEDQFDIVSGNTLVIKPNKIFRLQQGFERAVVRTDAMIIVENEVYFDYTNIFTICLSKNPTMILYYLNIFNYNKLVDFTFINNKSNLQFIVPKINWVRNMGEDEYTMNVTLTQSIKEDLGTITLDASGNIKSSKVSVYAIFKDKDGLTVRYKKLDIVGYEEENFEIECKLKLTTTNMFDSNGQLEITNTMTMKSETITPIYLPPTEANISLYIYYEEDTKYYTNVMDSQLPTLKPTDVLTNIYDIKGGIDFLLDYTAIMNSSLEIIRSADNPDKYVLKSSPMVRHSYCTEYNNISYLVNKLREKRSYLVSALAQLEHPVGLDFKFFNTYGPSKSFVIGHGSTNIDRVNISLKFAVKTYVGADSNIRPLIIQEIKRYIENVNDVSDLSISRLTKIILEKFTDVQDFEFKGINGYDTKFQNITNTDIDNIRITHTPEFLNVNNLSNTGYEPDIGVEIL